MNVSETVAPLSIIFLLNLALSGCATPIATTFYTLPPNEISTARTNSEITVGIGPFELPEYLNRPQIVTRINGAVVKREEFHRWAEPLTDMFVRTLASTVGGKLGSDDVFEYPYSRQFAISYHVDGSVQRFDVDADGRAVLEVQWAILDTDNALIHRGSRARFEATSTDAAVFTSRTAALSETVNSFGAEIAAALVRLTPPSRR